MATDIPLMLQTVYADLLDRARANAFAEAFPDDGAFTVKTLRGRRYWYFQASKANGRGQSYVGPETPELLGADRVAQGGAGTSAGPTEPGRHLGAAVTFQGRRRRSAIWSLLGGGGRVSSARRPGRHGRIPDLRRHARHPAAVGDGADGRYRRGAVFGRVRSDRRHHATDGGGPAGG